MRQNMQRAGELLTESSSELQIRHPVLESAAIVETNSQFHSSQ
jgi:hypothetical protein